MNQQIVAPPTSFQANIIGALVMILIIMLLLYGILWAGSGIINIVAP